ncbi:MAG: sulfotransferase, partial [Bacteroidota bacterium]|nr:sulfotransferase [Bacteroidota bacterium]
MSNQKVIKSKYYNDRPYWFRGLNAVWKASYPIGAKANLDRDNLLKTAQKITGLNDFGKDFQVEPLDRLITSIREEAQLHPIGYFITRQRFINLLNIRLRAEWWFKKHPEILEQPLYPVWMIMGLQRTGTTKLHRLLAADPDNRVLSSWEAINPVPLCKKWRSRDKRPKIARISEWALRLMAPGFFAIHPVE